MFHNSLGEIGNESFEMFEMSERLNPDRKDHPIEGTTEDEQEISDCLERTRLYTLEDFKSGSKVNPNPSIKPCSLSVFPMRIFREKLGTRFSDLMVEES